MVTWLFALPLELIIIGASLSIYTVPHREPTIGDPQGGRLHHSITGWEVLEVCVYFCRVTLLLGLSTIFLVYKIGAKYYHSQPGTPSSDDDQSPLLGRGDGPHAKPNGHAYGTNKSD